MHARNCLHGVLEAGDVAAASDERIRLVGRGLGGLALADVALQAARLVGQGESGAEVDLQAEDRLRSACLENELRREKTELTRRTAPR